MKHSKNVLILIFSSLYFFVFGVCHADSDQEIEHLKIKRLNDTFIDAYIKRPVNSKGKTGILLMLQGSGCLPSRDRLFAWEEKWNRQSKNRVAVLMAEKIGVNLDNIGYCSDEYRQHHTFHQRVYDYTRIIQSLRNSASWWNGKLYLMGGSEGGSLAAVLASIIPETKKVVMLVAGGGMTLAEAIPFGVADSMRKNGRPEYEIDMVLQQFKSLFDEIRNNPTPNQLLGSDPELGSVFQETYKLFASMLDIRPLNRLVDLNIPIYMAHGTEDTNDPVDSVYQTIDAFDDLGKKNLVYREYEGLDHGFNDINGIPRLQEVLTDAFDWLFESHEEDDHEKAGERR